jgi:hypothetical protein
VSGIHLGPATNFTSFFIFRIIFRQPRICWCRAPYVTRGWVCSFKCCWASSAQSFSGLSPTGIMTMFLLSQIWDSPNLEGQVPIFISPRNKGAQLYPPPPHPGIGFLNGVQFSSVYFEAGGQSWCWTLVWAHEQILPSLLLIWKFLDSKVGRPLWRKGSSVVCIAVNLWSGSHRTHNHILLFHMRLFQFVKVTLRPTISLPVRLGVRRPSGTRDQFFFLLEIFF